MTADSVLIPDAKTYFDLGDGKSFGLDLVEAVIASSDILTRSQGRPGFGYLDEWAAWVEQQGGPKLSRGQADWLFDFVQTEYARQKKTRLGTPTSATSMESTPSD